MPANRKSLAYRFSIMPLSKAGAQGAPKRFPLPDERYKVDLFLLWHIRTTRGATPYLAASAGTNTGAWQSFLERAGAAARNEAGAEQASALGCGPRD